MEQEPRKPQLEHLVDITNDHDEQEWQDLIDSIEATDVPIEMLKYLRVHLKDGTKMIFPVIKWVNEGANFEEIKIVVKKWYQAHNDEIEGSDFIVNLDKLKKIITSQTQKTLKDL